MKQAITVWVEPELLEHVRQTTGVQGVSISAWVREAIEERRRLERKADMLEELLRRENIIG